MDLSSDLFWSDSTFLKGCERLKQAGWDPDLVPGLRVARGFADLGYEEFLILPNRKLLSLFSGTISDGEIDKKHLIIVPTFEMLSSLISESDYQLESVVNLDDRRWRITLRDRRDLEVALIFDGPEMLTTLIESVVATIFSSEQRL